MVEHLNHYELMRQRERTRRDRKQPSKKDGIRTKQRNKFITSNARLIVEDIIKEIRNAEVIERFEQSADAIDIFDFKRTGRVRFSSAEPIRSSQPM